jgi:DEP domain-containing protein 5
MHEIQMLGLLEHDVLSSIEVPYLPNKTGPSVSPLDIAANTATTKWEADTFDLDIFSLTSNYNATNVALDLAGNNGPGLRTYADKRASHRNSAIIRISTIEESPKRIHLELPSEGLPTSGIGPPSVSIPAPVRSPSPPTSTRSARSEKSTASSKTTGWSGSLSKGTLASRLAPSWLFNPFRSGPSEPQTTQVSASASPTAGSHPREKQKESMEKLLTTDVSHSPKASSSSPIRMPPPSKPTVASSTQQIQPMAIRNRIANRSNLNRAFEEEIMVSHRTPHIRRSPISTPPPDDILAGKRRSVASTLAQSYTSMSPGTIMNPTRPQVSISQSQASLARRWQHVYPHSNYKYDFNWKSIATPGCLPLTVEHLPSSAVLDSSFDVFSYEFVVDPSEMRSFLAEPPIPQGSAEDLRRAWAMVVMRGMAAFRLAQGFQFILKPSNPQVEADKSNLKRVISLIGEEDMSLRPAGAAEVLGLTTDPVYLSMTNEIHRIVYTGETIQVRRYVRRMSPTRPFAYQCLIWPKLGGSISTLILLYLRLLINSCFCRWLYGVVN